MLDLEPGEELALIAETARRFAGEELVPRIRSAEADRALDAAALRQFEETGLPGLELPEAQGGAGLGCVARVLVNEELAAADAGAALALDGFGPALYPLLEMGLDPMDWSSRVSRSGARMLLVSDLDAKLEVGAERVTGKVAWVPACEAAAIVVLTRDRVAVVEQGYRFEFVRGAGLRAAGAAELWLEDAPIARSAVDEAGASRARARARLYVASLLLGVMRATCEFSRDYAQQREAFGRPIAHHQALAFLITDMYMAVEGARLVVHEAAWRLDAGLPGEAAAASALAQCIEASRTIGPDGVQILGGHGFMADYPVEKHMREARALGLLLGGFDAAVDEAGRSLCTSDAPLDLWAGEAL